VLLCTSRWNGFSSDDVTKDFILVIYRYLIVEYLTSCMAIFNIIVQIVLTVQRLLMVLNRKFPGESNSFAVIAILILISLFFYSPTLFIVKIIVIEDANIDNITNQTNQTNYSLVTSDFGQTTLGKSLLVLMPVLRICLATVVLPILSIIQFIFFRKYFQRKHKVRNSEISYIGKLVFNSVF